jgi:hypothetical protein
MDPYNPVTGCTWCWGPTTAPNLLVLSTVPTHLNIELRKANTVFGANYKAVLVALACYHPCGAAAAAVRSPTLARPHTPPATCHDCRHFTAVVVRAQALADPTTGLPPGVVPIPSDTPPAAPAAAAARAAPAAYPAAAPGTYPPAGYPAAPGYPAGAGAASGYPMMAAPGYPAAPAPAAAMLPAAPGAPRPGELFSLQMVDRESCNGWIHPKHPSL